MFCHLPTSALRLTTYQLSVYSKAYTNIYACIHIYLYIFIYLFSPVEIYIDFTEKSIASSLFSFMFIKLDKFF
jgi:hypothetical protein